jgi:hypothetical protein
MSYFPALWKNLLSFSVSARMRHLQAVGTLLAICVLRSKAGSRMLAHDESVLRAVSELLRRCQAIPASFLAHVTAHSPNLGQLLGRYNFLLSHTASSDPHTLRTALIERISHQLNTKAEPSETPKSSIEVCAIKNPVSQKKLLANRRNAQRSTGPKTLRGKQYVRLNALKFGILCQQTVVLPGETSEQFDVLLSTMRCAFRPETELEEQIMLSAARLIWKLRRCNSAEESLLFGTAQESQLRTLFRYDAATKRQLRKTIPVIASMQRKEKQMNGNATWDLRTDSLLWKEAKATGVTDDPNFQKRWEHYLGQLQKGMDQSDWCLFLVLDMIASAVISKRRVQRYEAAHLRIAEVDTEKATEKAGSSLRAEARVAAAFPSADILDIIIRYEGLRDREIQKGIELIDLLSRRAQERKSNTSRKPPVGVKEGVANKSAKNQS